MLSNPGTRPGQGGLTAPTPGANPLTTGAYLNIWVSLAISHLAAELLSEVKRDCLLSGITRHVSM